MDGFSGHNGTRRERLGVALRGDRCGVDHYPAWLSRVRLAWRHDYINPVTPS